MLFFIIFLIFGYNNIPVVAEEKPGEYKTEILEPKRSKILVGDPITGKAVLKNTAKFYYTKVKDWAIDKAWKELKESGDVLWRKALKNFLDTLAYDAAT
ncbi:hypothetical protein KKH16_00680, partial [Patescibacteria group bacterium]|nr:hypothetical protein [Patescibacteria group bacterium]